jgi:hypothetical protein
VEVEVEAAVGQAEVEVEVEAAVGQVEVAVGQVEAEAELVGEVEPA